MPLKYLQQIELAPVLTPGNGNHPSVIGVFAGPSRVTTEQLTPVTVAPPLHHTSTVRQNTSAATLDFQAGDRRSKSLSPLRRYIPESSFDNRPTSNPIQRKPQAPIGLSVEVVASQKLYLEWTYVQYLDHAARSNGTTVRGFRVSSQPRLNGPFMNYNCLSAHARETL